MITGSLTPNQYSQNTCMMYSFTHNEGILIEPSVPKMVRKSSLEAGKAGTSPVPASHDKCDVATLFKSQPSDPMRTDCDDPGLLTR